MRYIFLVFFLICTNFLFGQDKTTVDSATNSKIKHRTTKILVQVGQDIKTSAVCIAVLWFGLDKQR